MLHLSLKHDWPLAAIGGGIAILWFASSQSGASSGPSAIFPRTVGGQRGTPGRSSSTSNDSGSLATQVIGDVIGQRTALAEAHDQLLESEDELTTEQNIAYRESNVQTQLSLNQEQPPPSGWTQIFQSLIGAAGSFFGGPVGAGVLGVQPNYGYGGFGGGYPESGSGAPWWWPFGGGSSPPWGGYYPEQTWQTPYGGQWA